MKSPIATEPWGDKPLTFQGAFPSFEVKGRMKGLRVASKNQEPGNALSMVALGQQHHYSGLP